MTTRIYTGHSMWPTFRPGDALDVSQAAARLRPGDVAVFRVAGLPESRSVFVHRIMAVTKTGLVTQGDNNGRPDPWHVAPDHVVGIVTRCRRGNSSRRVAGGWAGALQVRVRRALIALGLQARRPLRAAYARLRASGIPARIWQPRVDSLRIDSPRGPVVKFMWRRRTVARWWPQLGRFACRKPFDLFLSHPGRERL